MSNPTKTPLATGKFEKFHALLEEAVNAWPEFDDDTAPVSGADLVEWFGAWRDEVKKALR